MSEQIKSSMNSDSNTDYKFILGMVNEWLKFAEAKHAGLLILNGVLIFGILNLFKDFEKYIDGTGLIFGIISFVISICLSLIAQFPVMSKQIFNADKDTSRPDLNFYYFGDLAKLNYESFVKLFDKNKIETERLDAYKMIIQQILINSRITKNKFICFQIGSYFTIFGIGIILCTSIIHIIY